ncbi:hypothetical protein BDV59DRAFT_179930 [Aspergillus ambiguus]|uniref:succinate:quinone oxidoreductase subunit C n=1 Tax=Aspergillus ambiguus TaxID=176160 RepID=UPI003CCD9907
MKYSRTDTNTPYTVLGARFPGSFRTTIASPRAVVTLNQTRLQAQSTKPQLQIQTVEQGQQHLARQRLRRPVSPHLSIYRWEMNMISSAMERNTGIMLSGTLYLFATAYLFSPMLGWDLSSASLVTAFGALPVAVKAGVKFLAAWPFTFHFFNGVRFTVAATAQTLKNRDQMAKIAWAMMGCSVVSAAGLAWFV